MPRKALFNRLEHQGDLGLCTGQRVRACCCCQYISGSNQSSAQVVHREVMAICVKS